MVEAFKWLTLHQCKMSMFKVFEFTGTFSDKHLLFYCKISQHQVFTAQIG